MSKQDAKWIKKDDVTIEGDGAGSSGNLRVKDNGIDENKINSSAIAANEGLKGGSGTALGMDINGNLPALGAAVDADELAIWDTTGGAMKKITRANLLAGAVTEQKIQYMHLITAGETTAGFFDLPSAPISEAKVSLTPVGGPQQVNKNVVGATGATPDFDLADFGANPTRVYFKNVAPGAGLSQDLDTGDVVIVEYEI